MHFTILCSTRACAFRGLFDLVAPLEPSEGRHNENADADVCGEGVALPISYPEPCRANTY